MTIPPIIIVFNTLMTKIKRFELNPPTLINKPPSIFYLSNFYQSDLDHRKSFSSFGSVQRSSEYDRIWESSGYRLKSSAGCRWGVFGKRGHEKQKPHVILNTGHVYF